MDEVKAAPPPVTETRVDRAFASAQSGPDLVEKMQRVDPDIADGIRRLLDNPWEHGPAYTLASSLMTWAVAHYGFGIDPSTSSLLAAGIVAAAWYGWQAVSRMFKK